MPYKSPLALSDALAHKKFEFSEDDLNLIKRMAQNHIVLQNYDLEDIDIDQIAQDTNLDNDTSMAERRANWWGNDINKYSITPEKLRNSYMTDPIRVGTNKEGKWQILDGHHRLKALKNMGYTQIPAFIKKTP